MDKQQVVERALLEIINAELAKSWPHRAHTCRVERLRRVSRSEGNWEVDTLSNGGPDLLLVGECDELRARVLAEVATKYNVRWE